MRLIFLWLLHTAAPATAQPTALAEVLDAAMLRSQTTLQAEVALQQAQALQHIEASRFVPTLQAIGTFEERHTAHRWAIFEDWQNIYRGGPRLQLGLRLLDLSQMFRWRASAAALRGAAQARAWSRLESARKASHQFFTVARHQGELAAIEARLSRARVAEDLAKARKAAQLGSDDEVLTQHIDVMQAQASAAAQRALLAEARGTLMVYTDLEINTVSLDAALEAAACTRLPALVTLLDEAATRRSDIAALSDQLQAKRTLVTAARLSMLPTLHAFAAGGTTSWQFTRPLYELGATLRWSIFDYPAAFAGSRLAESQAAEIHLQRDILIRQVRQQLLQGHAKLLHLCAGRAAAQEAARGADAHYLAIQAAYRAGIGKIEATDVLVASGQQTEAQRSQVRAAVDAVEAYLGLRTAAGFMPLSDEALP